MANLDLFCRKLLEHFARQKDCYHNLFLRESAFLREALGRNPEQKEIVIAQKAFQKLIDDGFIYDPEGSKWYTITEEGQRHLQTGDAPPVGDSVEMYLKKYDLHPRIKAVSSRLFADGHYKEAIQAALVEVITRVKEAGGNPKDGAGRDIDGDTLMQKVFGCDGENVPLIKLNDLQDSFDKAEQRGFMWIYKGIVGIRDKKAHLNFIQNDPNRTVEYLCLASLLMRLLENDFLSHFNTREG
jgi:uncharacterized protein (TIGR02391 family)